MTTIDLLQLAIAMTGDEAGRLTKEDAERALHLALLRYSSDRPYQALARCTAPQGATSFPLPPDWEPGFSRVLMLEKTESFEPLAADSWQVQETPDGWLLHMYVPFPESCSLWLRYTVSHSLETIPGKDVESVAHWAAALLLDQLASLYSGDRQSTIDADVVDHQSKGNTYAARAAEHRKLYLDHLGIDPKRTVAAGAVVSIGGAGLLHARPRRRPIR